MATYNMLDILPLQLFENSWGDDTTLWEIVGGEVLSTSPYTATKSNALPFIPYSPFPVLIDGPGTNFYDLSPYGDDGDFVDLQLVGRVSYRENITAVEFGGVYAQLTQNGDWLEFVIPFGAGLGTTVDSISSYSPNSLMLQFFSGDATPLENIELQYGIEISISDSSSSAAFNFTWETRAFQSPSSCNYNVASVESVSLLSATLYVYEDNTSFFLSGTCVENVLEADGDVIYTEDVSSQIELDVDGGNIVLYNWSHPEVSRTSKFSMDLSAEVYIDGRRYTTSLIARSPEVE